MRTALVVGCASCIWDDVSAASAMVKFDKIYCVKLAGAHWPWRFDVWATLHPEFMDEYELLRKKKNLPDGYEIVAPPVSEVGMHGNKGCVSRRVTYRWRGMTSSASSGIYGAKVALDDGMERVVLAGIPMTDLPHFSRGDKPWLQRGCFLPGFELAIPFLRGRVRSMSGMTREELGVPTPEWLAGG